MEKGLQESDTALKAQSYALSKPRLLQGVQIARDALTDNNTTAAKAALANRLLSLGTLLLQQQDATEIGKSGIQVATDCASMAKEGNAEPLRLVQCQALLATMRSSTGVSEGNPAFPSSPAILRHQSTHVELTICVNIATTSISNPQEVSV